MTFGIVVQTIAITSVTLAAYFIGLSFYPEAAKTMAFVTLSFSELLRAFTARSEFYPILKIGLFTNKAMNWGVLVSLILLLAVVYTPFLNEVFNTVPLIWAEWQYVLPLLLIPAIAAELTKFILSRKQIAIASGNS
jgi:Ca2+-transporting ATPase